MLVYRGAMAHAFCCMLHRPGPVNVQTEDLSGACCGCLPAGTIIFFSWKPKGVEAKLE